VEEEDDTDEPQAAQAADIESILGLCRARGLPEKMLRWHYRSRHHSLIAVSNHEFYEDKLFIVPSQFLSNPELGLKFHFVEGGVFDSGASATNRIGPGLFAVQLRSRKEFTRLVSRRSFVFGKATKGNFGRAGTGSQARPLNRGVLFKPFD
jgi:superfamily I DNA and/or RNA helicase